MCLEFKVKDVEPSKFKCDVDYDSSLSPMSHDLLLVLFVPRTPIIVVSRIRSASTLHSGLPSS